MIATIDSCALNQLCCVHLCIACSLWAQSQFSPLIFHPAHFLLSLSLSILIYRIFFLSLPNKSSICAPYLHTNAIKLSSNSYPNNRTDVSSLPQIALLYTIVLSSSCTVFTTMKTLYRLVSHFFHHFTESFDQKIANRVLSQLRFCFYEQSSCL